MPFGGFRFTDVTGGPGRDPGEPTASELFNAVSRGRRGRKAFIATGGGGGGAAAGGVGGRPAGSRGEKATRPPVVPPRGPAPLGQAWLALGAEPCGEGRGSKRPRLQAPQTFHFIDPCVAM